MEFRSLIAIILSMIVLIGFQYLYGNKTAHKPEQLLNQSNSRLIEQDKTATEQTKREETPEKTPPLAHVESLPPTGPSRVARDVTVETSLYRMTFSEQGATLKECLLKRYPANLSPDSPPVNLVNTVPPEIPLGVALGSTPPVDLSNQIFDADKTSLILNKIQKDGALNFSYKLPDGLSVLKTYTFHEGNYWVDLTIQIKNADAQTYQPITISLYNKPFSKENGYVFSGPQYYTNGGLTEVKLGKPGEKSDYSGLIDWAGYGDNYFLTAIVPIKHENSIQLSFEKRDATGLTVSRLTTPIKADDANSLHLGLYFGPKEIETLNALGHNLAGSIDFGWFTPIAKPLLYFLNFLYRYFHNYGIAIIIITGIIKIAFWPLAHKSAKSMKTMQKLQPKLAKLKEKYANDKEAMNRELMQLYKTYKVNPMSGCLPMLLQIPVFFALYKVLLQAIELRHAPFALWINDLSAPDRLMIPGITIPILGGIPVLTLLMGASMYLQQKMTPSSLDPTQAKMMQILPVVFTFMFINFPSGLVLYWLVNNIFSIVQQYYINKFTD